MDEGKTWSPYLGRALTELVGILSVVISVKFLGASTTVVRSAAMIEK